ncbi:MAG: hypothetical protein IJB21_07885 [Bacilli bacterium]|nr:hypothetical protein [Bacilli bacterium]
MKKNKIILLTMIYVVSLLIFVLLLLSIESYKCDAIINSFNDSLHNGNGQSVKVIILAGQSNASGCSRDDYLRKNVSTDKYLEYETGYDNVYINYFASSSNVSNGFVKCSTRQGEAGGYFGPELGIAERLHDEFPNEMFFIIKWAWGGTNLYDQWLSPSSKGKTGKLYKQFIKYVDNSLMYLEHKNYNIKIEGLCWMQGESDSFSEENAINYKNNLNNFINDIRKKFSKYASNDGLAFIDACIANNPVYWVYCDFVNESKKEVSKLSNLNTLIDTNACGLSCSNEPIEAPDIPHYDSLSQIKLGNLFAEELIKFF